MSENPSNVQVPENKMISFLAYPLWIVAYILYANNKEFNRFDAFHLRQGFKLFILWLIIGIVGMILIFITSLASLLYLVCVAFCIIGIINVSNDETKPLPVLDNVLPINADFIKEA